MVTEPEDAPVPEGSKRNFYIGLVIAIIVGAFLVIFVLPNIYASTTEGPAVESIDGVIVPDADGLETMDGEEVVEEEPDPAATLN